MILLSRRITFLSSSSFCSCRAWFPWINSITLFVSHCLKRQKVKEQTLDPGLCIRKSGPLSLNPPLHRPHQFPSGSHCHLTPLEALLPRHQGRVGCTHSIKNIPRQERISIFFLHRKK